MGARDNPGAAKAEVVPALPWRGEPPGAAGALQAMGTGPGAAQGPCTGHRTLAVSPPG